MDCDGQLRLSCCRPAALLQGTSSTSASVTEHPLCARPRTPGGRDPAPRGPSSEGAESGQNLSGDEDHILTCTGPGTGSGTVGPAACVSTVPASWHDLERVHILPCQPTGGCGGHKRGQMEARGFANCEVQRGWQGLKPQVLGLGWGPLVTLCSLCLLERKGVGGSEPSVSRSHLVSRPQPGTTARAS